MPINISEICKGLCIEYQGIDHEIDGINLCNRRTVRKCILSYVTGEQFSKNVKENVAISTLILPNELTHAYSKDILGRKLTFIISENPEKTFYDIHDWLIDNTDFYEKNDFPPIIGENCHIDETAIIKSGVTIGSEVSIGAHTVVQKGTKIGNNTYIGCNTTLGSEGFQVLRIDGKNRKIRHVAGLHIGSNVSIGDNCTIANSLFEDTTYIGDEVMIDNLVYVGHNSVIESGAEIAAGSTLLGSSYIEANAFIGAGTVQLNRTCVGERALIGIGSVITRDVMDNVIAYGNPAKAHRKRYNYLEDNTLEDK